MPQCERFLLVVQCAAGERTRHRKAATRALDILRSLPVPQPQVGDAVDVWLPARVVPVLHRHGIRTLADLTVRIPRRRRWWLPIPGLGERSARWIDAFFAAHPALTERTPALIAVATPEPVVPWENIRVPHDVNGSRGTFRAPKPMCALEADNDYQAISAWLERHEAAKTDVIAENVRHEQRKVIKYNHLVANMVILYNVQWMSRKLKELQQKGHPVDADILKVLSPYRQEHINRLGDYLLDLLRPVPPLDPTIDFVFKSAA